MKDSLKYFGKRVARYVGPFKYLVLLGGVLVASLGIAAGIYTHDIKTYTIINDGELLEITTRCETVGEALKQADIVLGEGDLVNYDLDQRLETVTSFIEVKRPVTITIHVEGEAIRLSTFSSNVSMALQEAGVSVNGKDILEGASMDSELEDGLSVHIVRVDDTVQVIKEAIPYDTTYIEDRLLLKGRTRVATQGVEGVRTLTYKIVEEDGVEVSRELISEEIIPPVTEIIAQGTREYFTNSRGQTVSYSKSLQMRATAFGPHPKWGYISHTGNKLQLGVVAVDPSVIPLGTKLYVKTNDGSRPDYGFAIAWDTGVHGDIIDLFMGDKATCSAWGVRGVTVYILDDQSVDIFALRG